MKLVKSSCMVLCIAIMVSILCPAYAEPEIQPFYTYTHVLVATMSISGGVAKCGGGVTPINTAKTTTTVYLQQYISGRWIQIAQWTGTNQNGTSQAGGTKTVTAGYSYRVQVVGKVYNSAGYAAETVIGYSSVKTI